MNRSEIKAVAFAGLLVALLILAARERSAVSNDVPTERQEVVFWHFWGGDDRRVVESIVQRFNERQNRHWVRPIAMPGSNLDLKLFLGVAGGEPPDVVNQDDPIVGDWAARGTLTPLDELAISAELEEIGERLFPAALALGTFQNRLYALCNGLDIRALYYDAELLDEFGLRPPKTIAELDAAALTIAPAGADENRTRYGFLPDPRRIWAWGIVFGGQFFDPASGELTLDNDRNVAALDWMASYARRYGAANVLRFRAGDQKLPGAAFPLLQERYAMIMDGQWRVREIAADREAAIAAGRRPHRYGVTSLPVPPGGREKAGWVNGNFFVVPRGGKNPQGAWEFMKFWSGIAGHEADAAQACAAGGWIPVSQAVVEQPAFQTYLERNPDFRTFVELAGSPNQVPTPQIVGAPYLQDEAIRAAEDAIYGGADPGEALRAAQSRVEPQRRELVHEAK
jgi:multiple sugar transport system substrate-binding protein